MYLLAIMKEKNRRQEFQSSHIDITRKRKSFQLPVFDVNITGSSSLFLTIILKSRHKKHKSTSKFFSFCTVTYRHTQRYADILAYILIYEFIL